MIIEFGRWQLRPIDSRNWGLATTKAWEKAESYKNPKTPNSIRYFRWPNIGYAVHYAASRDLMDKEGTATPWEAAEELTRTVDALLAQCCHALDNYTNPTAKTLCDSIDTPQNGK